MATSQYIRPVVACCHIRPIPLSVTVPSPLSTHLSLPGSSHEPANAFPDTTRQSRTAITATARSFFMIFSAVDGEPSWFCISFGMIHAMIKMTQFHHIEKNANHISLEVCARFVGTANNPGDRLFLACLTPACPKRIKGHFCLRGSRSRPDPTLSAIPGPRP
jgi:hypothetical protein